MLDDKISFTVGIPKCIPQVLGFELCAGRSVSAKSRTLCQTQKNHFCINPVSVRGGSVVLKQEKNFPQRFKRGDLGTL